MVYHFTGLFWSWLEVLLCHGYIRKRNPVTWILGWISKCRSGSTDNDGFWTDRLPATGSLNFPYIRIYRFYRLWDSATISVALNFDFNRYYSNMSYLQMVHTEMQKPRSLYPHLFFTQCSKTNAKMKKHEVNLNICLIIYQVFHHSHFRLSVTIVATF